MDFSCVLSLKVKILLDPCPGSRPSRTDCDTLRNWSRLDWTLWPQNIEVQRGYKWLEHWVLRLREVIKQVPQPTATHFRSSFLVSHLPITYLVFESFTNRGPHLRLNKTSMTLKSKSEREPGRENTPDRSHRRPQYSYVDSMSV